MNQFVTHCKGCGKQIVMTRNEETGQWMPCNPMLHRYRAAGGPLTFINCNGKVCRGERDINGEVGYQRHRCGYGRIVV